MNGINMVYGVIKPVPLEIVKKAPRIMQGQTTAKLLKNQCSKNVLKGKNPIIEAFKKADLSRLGKSAKELIGRFLGAQGDFCTWFPQKIN